MNATQTIQPDSPLTVAEIEEISTEAGHYPHKSGASIEALKVVQKYRGWVSDECLNQVADLLDMSAEELDQVATFYNLIYRRPVGKKVILCCDSVSCWMLGADRVQERISQWLGVQPGGTTADGEYTLLPIVCLGACDHAPVIMVGDKLHHDVEPDKLDKLFDTESL